MVKWPFSRRVKGLGEPPDYYREGLKLANQEKFHEALTSFRLALRANPDDHEIMQQMAVIYTHIGMPDEAVKYYEEAIRAGGDSAASHYGLAFLFLRRGDEGRMAELLEPHGEGVARGRRFPKHVSALQVQPGFHIHMSYPDPKSSFLYKPS